jgi:putative ABC transport system permease protein
MDVLSLDVRQALRALRRDAGFTTTTVLTLTLGIGLNAAVFSVLHAVLLAPLPYPDADRLAVLWTQIPAEGVTEGTSAYANVQDWRTRTRSFEDLATYDPTTLTLTGDGPAEQITAILGSANLLDVYGLDLDAGRTFTSEEEGLFTRLAVASRALAERLFGSPAAAIGRTVVVGGQELELIGVLDDPLSDADLWLPQTLFTDWAAQSVRRGTDALRVVGRLAPGVSLAEASSDMSAIAAQLETEHPENVGLGIRVVTLYDQVTGTSFRLALWALFGAVGIVLLIACANAAHLSLARALDKSRDLAVRTALGASTSRLLRQAITESAVLAALAGVLGVGLARLALPAFVAFAPADMPRAANVALNGTVLAYLAVLSLVVGILFGVVPIVANRRLSIYHALREGRGVTPDRAKLRVRRLLITGQLALALVLVFTASLVVRSFLAATRVDPGFEPGGLLMANFSVQSPDERIGFYRGVVESVSALPGVDAAGLIEDLFIGGAPNASIIPEGRTAGDVRTETRTEIRIDAIDGDFFEAVGASMRAGRALDATDGSGPPVAVINETMAERFWPDEEAVGQRFRTGANAPWIEVVGIVADMRRQGPERAPIAQVFVPYVQAPSRNMNLLVRSDLPAEVLVASMRERIAEVSRSVPFYGVTTVVTGMDGYVAGRRLQTFLLGLFSSLAVALAALGIYGLVQYSVSRRTREIGVRVALGAYSAELQRMVVREGLMLALPGILIGVLGSFWIAGALRALLYGVTPADPVSVLVTSLTLLLVTLLAAYVPARRAARVDPVTALRSS